MGSDKRVRVILIDDQDDVRSYLKSILGKLDCDVVGEAENGKKGVELFKKVKPDLVLLDLKMPVMNGGEALNLIMADDPDAQVILLTAVDDSMDIMSKFDAGARYYIQKDSPPDKIRSILEEQINNISEMD